MATSKLTITLTDDQQRQIREATGQTATELIVEPAAANELSDQELDGVVGGTAPAPPPPKEPVVYLKYTMTTVL